MKRSCKLILDRIVWTLYVHSNEFIAIFDTPEEAIKFAKIYYNTLPYHVEPRPVFKVSMEES